MGWLGQGQRPTGQAGMGCKQNYTQNSYTEQVIIRKVMYAINVIFAQ